MRMIFTTTRNRYGHRYYLLVDYEKRAFSRRDRWYSGEEIEITQKEMHRILADLEKAGFARDDEMY